MSFYRTGHEFPEEYGRDTPIVVNNWDKWWVLRQRELQARARANGYDKKSEAKRAKVDKKIEDELEAFAKEAKKHPDAMYGSTQRNDFWSHFNGRYQDVPLEIRKKFQ